MIQVGLQFEPECSCMLIDTDVLRMVLGNTRWALGFTQYILNEIFDLADDFESILSDQEAFSQKCMSTLYDYLIEPITNVSQ